MERYLEPLAYALIALVTALMAAGSDSCGGAALHMFVSGWFGATAMHLVLPSQ